MTMDYTRADIKKAYQKLPPVVQDIVLSNDTVEKIEDIQKKYDLNQKQAEVFENEVELLMMGLIHSDEFISNLKEKLEITEEKADGIATEVDEKIFKGIREVMMRGGEKKSEAPNSKNEGKILDPRVREDDTNADTKSEDDVKDENGKNDFVSMEEARERAERFEAEKKRIEREVNDEMSTEDRGIKDEENHVEVEIAKLDVIPVKTGIQVNSNLDPRSPGQQATSVDDVHGDDTNAGRGDDRGGVKMPANLVSEERHISTLQEIAANPLIGDAGRARAQKIIDEKEGEIGALRDRFEQEKATQEKGEREKLNQRLDTLKKEQEDIHKRRGTFEQKKKELVAKRIEESETLVRTTALKAERGGDLDPRVREDDRGKRTVKLNKDFFNAPDEAPKKTPQTQEPAPQQVKLVYKDNQDPYREKV